MRMVWPGADGAVAARECDILMTLLGRAPHSLVSEPSGEGSASVMPGFVQGGRGGWPGCGAARVSEGGSAGTDLSPSFPVTICDEILTRSTMAEPSPVGCS